jgi:sec-independent protein translocase protein TatA
MEWLLILACLLLVFGASRLPKLGESIGKAVRGLKRGLNTDEDIEVNPKEKQVAEKSSAKSVSEAKVETKDVAEAEIVEK